MRILIVTGIFPPAIGGPATYVPLIASELAARSHQVTVVALTDRDGHDDGQYAFRVVRFPERRPKLLWRFGTMVRLLAHARRADVMFVNGLDVEAALTNVLLRKPLVQKIVGDRAWEGCVSRGWTHKGFEEFQVGGDLRMRLAKALRSWAARTSGAVVVPSEYLAGWVRGWGVRPSVVKVVHNSVEAFPDIAPASVPVSAAIKLLTVGRLVPWKRVDGILLAIQSVSDVALVIVGEGPERDRLEALAGQYGLAARTCFVGTQSLRETRALMAACDIFVLNSTYEGLPHVVLEAMAMGLPVVATAVGGTPEALANGVNGFLVEPDDPAALTAAISRLASDPALRASMGEKGRETVRARFRVERMVEDTQAVLAEAADLKSRRRVARRGATD